MTFISLLLVGGVGVAGAFGALARYSLGRFLAERVGSRFPVGTFVINITGAFLIGLLFALTGHKVISSSAQLVLATGFLGGYTTFSTMNWEGMQLARGGSTWLSLLYLAGSLLVGLLAASLGLVLGGGL
ncbi:fluoride efflux transporter CrcB [Ktedonosporobacter rubrisoli]|uniref:Fluoride-specific ion channel FluC n=1 Tax=Ktedonosporobacter rubrisoli TaxID=2509675 RepID=A0A4P6K339_KTERU|nr:fluoride efflux transporter CrcB [Ktedonosporobacter rubrisoli]QBD82657.1 fluoride efflux transporter CrcB [Ktedonosporobacter rubrisoli]